MKNFTQFIKIAVAIFFALGLVACENQSKKKDETNNPETFAITFSGPEHGNLVAMREKGNAEFKSGDMAKKDEVIIFSVSHETGYEVESWNVAKEDDNDKTKARLKVSKAVEVSVKLKTKQGGTPQPGADEFTCTAEGVSFVMRKIPEANNAKLGSGGFAVNPVHTVSISEFYMCETEITQELWEAVMKNNPSWFNGDPAKTSKQAADGEVQNKRPVESVSWYDVVNFCNELTKVVKGSSAECVYTITNIEKNDTKHPHVITKAEVSADFSKKGYRLPTEAEWEWAAKGGKEDTEYPGIQQLPDEEGKKFRKRFGEYGWTTNHHNVQNRTHEVKKLKPNEYGLYDMAGNVMEWCWDWWSKLEENKQYEKDYAGVITPDSEKAIKIQKGGSYLYTVALSGVAARSEEAKTQVPENISRDRGFRVVCR